MKHLYIFPLLLTSVLLSDELSWVNEQVEAIKPTRQGVTNKNLSHIKNPFVFLSKNRDEEVSKPKQKLSPVSVTRRNTVARTSKKNIKSSKVLSINLIMNNSVMINRNWYKLGDVINGFTISEIHTHTVLLTKKKKRVLLSTKSSDKKIKFN